MARRFELWSNSKEQSRNGKIAWRQTHHMYQEFFDRDGEVFKRFYYDTKNRALMNPLQFEFVDPDQISGYGYTATNGYQSYDDGIIRDERGRETAYKVWTQNPKTGKPEYKEIPATGRSGRIHMLHCYDPIYAGQLRGYPDMVDMIQEFENITDFTSAQIKKSD